MIDKLSVGAANILAGVSLTRPIRNRSVICTFQLEDHCKSFASVSIAATECHPILEECTASKKESKRLPVVAWRLSFALDTLHETFDFLKKGHVQEGFDHTCRDEATVNRCIYSLRCL
jgi:hypothetical protein